MVSDKVTVGFANTLIKNIIRDKYLLILIFPVVLYFFIFCYVPMYGVIIAFKDFNISKGILGSPWIGFKYFSDFFSSIYCFRLIRNTLMISLYNLAWGFPIPIIFALMLNEVRNRWFKRVVQTVSYLPHFVSIVVVVGMMVNFLAPGDGIVNISLKHFFGLEPIAFFNESKWFRFLYIGSDVWQNFGWNSIIYFAALAGISPELYESAVIDGANRWKQLWHITMPSISNTIVILMVLNMGFLMSVGFEKIILMYNPSTYEVADVISTYVYRRGILNTDFSFGAAVGLFNSVVNMGLLLGANAIGKRVSDISLF